MSLNFKEEPTVSMEELQQIVLFVGIFLIILLDIYLLKVRFVSMQ